MRTNSLAYLCAVAGLGLVGCPGPVVTPPDTNVGFSDTGPRDAGRDARGDSGAVDAFVASDTGCDGGHACTGGVDTGTAIDAFAESDAGADAFVVANDAFGIDAFSVLDAFGPDAFVLPMDAGRDAFIGPDAGRDAFVGPDAGRDAFTRPDAFHGDAFLGACAPATHLVINEIDYDQPGATPDAAEFVEIFNPTAASIDLTGVNLVLVSGSSPFREYGRVALTGMVASGGYVVVTAAASSAGAFGVMLPATATRFTFTGMGLTDRIQNGAPDAVVLVNGATVVDAAAYEGAVTRFLPPTGATETAIMESASIGADSNTEPGSLARRPNGCDRDTPMMDWYVTAPTPGAAN